MDISATMEDFASVETLRSTTVKLKLSFMSPVQRQYTCVQIALLNMVLLGMNNVWASPMVVKLQDVNQTVLSRPITEDEGAWIVSIFLLGGVTAPLYSGFLMNKIGRKTTLILSNIPRLLFCFIAVFATEYWMILVARALGGIADFMCLSVVSTYSSEIANKKIRGQSGTMIQINSATGMLIVYGLGPYVSYVTMNVVMTVMAVASCIPLLFLPESPFYLYTRGKINEATDILTFLHGSEDAANAELKEYSSRIIDEEVVIDNKWALFKERAIIKSFSMVFVLSCVQPLLGYATVHYFLQPIFETAHTTIGSELSSVILGLFQMVACSSTFLLTNRFKRKTILCTTLIAMFIGNIGLSAFFTMRESGKDIYGFLNYLPLISAAVVIYGFNAGMGSFFWMLLAELLYGPVRAYGISLGVFLTSLASFIVNLTFPAMTRSIGVGGSFWTYTAGCAFTCFYIAMFVPETKDKTFAEIQTALGMKTRRLSKAFKKLIK